MLLLNSAGPILQGLLLTNLTTLFKRRFRNVENLFNPSEVSKCWKLVQSFGGFRRWELRLVSNVILTAELIVHLRAKPNHLRKLALSSEVNKLPFNVNQSAEVNFNRR
ncbi:MAG: hypothetical protein ACTS5A_03530 [Candidatus Hodgkinia cicadicola]